jgi:membrane protein implicated in regulation of membrane protease activity
MSEIETLAKESYEAAQLMIESRDREIARLIVEGEDSATAKAMANRRYEKAAKLALRLMGDEIDRDPPFDCFVTYLKKPNPNPNPKPMTLQDFLITVLIMPGILLSVIAGWILLWPWSLWIFLFLVGLCVVAVAVLAVALSVSLARSEPRSDQNQVEDISTQGIGSLEELVSKAIEDTPYKAVLDEDEDVADYACFHA